MAHGAGRHRPAPDPLRGARPGPAAPLVARAGPFSGAPVPTIACGLLLVLFHALPAQSPTATLSGRVTSFATERPLEGARIAVADTDLAATTDAEGRFVLHTVPVGVRFLRITFQEWLTSRVELRVRPYRENEVEIRVAVEPIPLPALRVSIEGAPAGKLAGFHDRMGSATGVFITREEIERRSPTRTSDLFRSLPGIRVEAHRPGHSSIAIARGPRECRIEYFLDGMPVPSLGVDAVSPEEIDGIEVYRGPAQVPPRFRRELTCAAVVIWTRDPGR